MEEEHPFAETAEKSEELRENSDITHPIGIPGNNGGRLWPGANGQEKLGGRPKGSKNRATLLNQFMDLRVKRRHPISGSDEEKTIEEWIELEMIAKVLEERDLGTFKEIKDTRFGKITDNLNLTGDVDLSQAIKIEIGFDALEKEITE